MDNDKHTPGCFTLLPFKLLSRKVKAFTIPRHGAHKDLNLNSGKKGDLDSYDIKNNSVDAPPSYSLAISDKSILHSRVLKTIDAKIDELNSELRELSIDIHDHPELMFKEHYAHDLLTNFMFVHGFTVIPHYLGLATAWRASFKYGTGGPVLGINSEMDALPGIGHACGHNLIAISGVGVALGVKAAMETHGIAGEVILLGTPAEEGGGGKVMLLEAGGYDDMDLCIMSHPGPGPDPMFTIPGSLAIQGIDVEFIGHTAHASGAPWEGINALDAAVLAYTNISALRQQIKPTHRIHGIIEGKDWAPNIIPGYAKLSYIVRAPNKDEVTELTKRVTACFDAAAMATGCKHTFTYGLPYNELQQNPVLGREFTKLASERYGMSQAPPQESQASTDFGNVSKALPSLHPGYSIPSPTANHTPEFTNAARTPIAHANTILATKALAGVGAKALSDDEYLKEVKAEFEAAKRAAAGEL